MVLVAISLAVCVGEQVADTVVSEISERLASLKVGVGLDINNDMGPLITSQHLEKVIGYVDLGIEEDATLSC
jgi:malonate-semialdehyde dehydrogenase (acetylating)/methylmalonate-semialdehyde dehydrogenase